MMISGMVGGAGLWDIPELRVFSAVTCRILSLISSTLREPIGPDWREHYSLHHR